MQTCAIETWFDVIIRCEFRTPFGSPVDPDVSNIFPIVSGPIAAAAASTSGPGGASSQSDNSSAPSGAPSALPTTSLRPDMSIAASAFANGAGLSTKITAGSLCPITMLSFSWSWLIRE